MTTFADIQSEQFYQSIWRVLREKFNAQHDHLPTIGVVAGQAVASACFEVLGLGTGPFRDLDWFVDSLDARHHVEDEIITNPYVNAFTPQKDSIQSHLHVRGQSTRLLAYVESASSFSFDLKTGTFDKSHYRIHSSFLLAKTPYVNVVEVSAKAHDGKIDANDIIRGFDINACQIGLDLAGKRVVFTSGFVDFLNTGILQITNLATPAHTAFRLLKKQKDISFARVDVDKEMRVLQMARDIGVHCEYRGWLRGHLFQQTTWEKYSEFHEVIAKYFTLSSRYVEVAGVVHQLCTLDVKDMRAQDAVLVQRIIQRTDLMNEQAPEISYLMLSGCLLHRETAPDMSPNVRAWWDSLGGDETLSDEITDDPDVIVSQLLLRLMASDPAGADKISSEDWAFISATLCEYYKFYEAWAFSSRWNESNGSMFEQVLQVCKNIVAAQEAMPFLLNAFATQRTHNSSYVDEPLTIPSLSEKNYLEALEWATFGWVRKSSMPFHRMINTWLRDGFFDGIGDFTCVKCLSNFEDFKFLSYQDQSCAVKTFSRMERGEIVGCTAQNKQGQMGVLLFSVAKAPQVDGVLFSMYCPANELCSKVVYPFPAQNTQLVWTKAKFESLGGCGEAMYAYLMERARPANEFDCTGEMDILDILF